MPNWTGERLETFVDHETTLEHLHRYAIVLGLVKGKNVLDIASGEGYGSNLLADVANRVVGVDISKKTISAATKKYNKSNLEFLLGSAAEIPCADNTFDFVISFETLEHHNQHEEMMLEIKRVLKPMGTLIISSPDKLNYTDKANLINEHHIKELYENEFKYLISKHFTNIAFYKQKPTFSSLIVSENKVSDFVEYTGNFQSVGVSSDFGQLYFLAIASENYLPQLAASAFTDDTFLKRMITANTEKIKNSVSYRLGHTALLPFKIIKKLFRNN